MEPTQVVKSGDVELAVYTWGTAGQKPTVLLVHGYPDNAGIWAATAERLAEKYFVVAYDVRGAGRSTRPATTAAYRLEHLVADLAAVIDAVSPAAKVHLVCHDWGSMGCWEAVTTGPVKDRIASYTSISGPCLDHVGHWLRQRLKSGSRDALAQLARQLGNSWYMGVFQLPLLAPGAWKLGLGKAWPKLLARIDGAAPDINATQAEDGSAGVGLYRANILERVFLDPQDRRTDTPVLLVCPTRDRFMVPEIWDDVPQWVPNLWRRDVDAGHWLPVSRPETLAAWVSEFIEHAEGGAETAALQRARVRSARRRREFSGKLVVVTGAGSGIGRETLLTFAALGADVIAVDIDAGAAERSAADARVHDVAAFARKVDVGSVAEMEALARQVEQDFGAPDIVVNNAGIGMAGAVLDTTAADWDRILRINLGGVIHGSTLFGRQMVAAGKRGHIVNVSSGLAFFPSRSTPAYATTKAAVQMLSECLRAELSGKRIGVSGVYPGVVDTPIVSKTQFNGAGDAEGKRARAQKLYDRRNLPPKAVAEAIVDGVRHNRPEIRVGAEVHAIRLVSRFLPGLTRRLARIEVAK